MNEPQRPLTEEEQFARKVAARARRIARLELRMKVFQLRRGGASYREIARLCEISVGRAHQIVDEELTKITQALGHSVEQLRVLELERIDSLLVRLDGLMKPSKTVKQTRTTHLDGSVTEDTITSEKRPGVGYYFAYLRALARRAALLGLDMPKKLELTTPAIERELSDEDLDAEIAKAMQEIDAAHQRVAAREGTQVH